MNSKLVELLRRETTPQLRRNVVLMSTLSGVASAAILAVINAASQHAEYGNPDFRYLFMFVMAIAMYVFSLRYTFNSTTRAFETILDKTRRRISDKIRHSELLVLDQIGRTEIYSRLTQDTAVLSQLEMQFAAAIQSAAMVLFIALYIISLSIYAFLLTVLLMIGGIVIYLRADKNLKKTIEYTSQKEMELFELVTHLIEGFQQIRLNRQRSDDLYADAEAISQVVRESKIQTASLYNSKYILSQAFFYANLAAIVFVLPQLIPTYLETLSDVTVAIVFFIGPLTVVVSSIPAYFRANIAAEHISALEQRLDEFRKEPSPHAIQRIDSFSKITLTDVEFAYQDEDNAERFRIGPLSFDINAGEVLFIVGGNGSGKSTLLKVLTSLYLPQKGTLKIDELTVDSDTIHAYRELFSIIFSDFHLFNKLYGLHDVDSERVDELLYRMQLENKTGYAEGRFTSLDLSTGQRKRMALLVALLEDKPIYIFDEWAAEQDPEFRSYFYEHLLHELQSEGKTVIAVSHDDRYFHHADRIIKIEYGNLVFDQASPPSGDEQ
jgi:putative ATP-binding cassette transporter